MYWNPNGVAISADPNIRQICQEQDISPSSEGYNTGFILSRHYISYNWYVKWTKKVLISFRFGLY